ncbi:hypothetical protein POSPLADRAFT_1037680 [Postia placenta MAD-698-R-SB12]|uniref:Uncharacterized protein n=1 Tax=Postia placenta MAD-698-R-SB12 TaxID=670580 RepID=A0A1X6MHT8_9APHY|nr:hypothetical protein POSPLADRAFT_1037680 [Postia placenta MAD-698-R-SB12]OSX55981.1 hypothetical protein POSPLADRAFT_1037680 [Postia placenta MAD-698-R-SB12]
MKSDGECIWSGGINFHVPDGSQSEWSGSDSGSESDLEASEMEGKKLVKSLCREYGRFKMKASGQPTAYEELQRGITSKDWKKAEGNWCLRYTRNSDRTGCRNELFAQQKETPACSSPYYSQGASMMCAFLTKGTKHMQVQQSTHADSAGILPSRNALPVVAGSNDNTIFTGYLSNISSSEDELDKDDNQTDPEDEDGDSPGSDTHTLSSSSVTFHTQAPLPLKRQKLNISFRQAHKNAKKAQQKESVKALAAIEKLIDSKCAVFESEHNGLQAHCAQAIQSCLRMVVDNQQKLVDASQRAAESHRFAVKWGR